MDDTETLRRELAKQINASPYDRSALMRIHGLVYDTEELRSLFDVIGFSAPLVVVKRKSDGVKGSLVFQHSPRFYYNFVPD